MFLKLIDLSILLFNQGSTSFSDSLTESDNALSLLLLNFYFLIVVFHSLFFVFRFV